MFCFWLILFLCGAVDDSATESEGDGNAREVTVATVAPPAARAPKKEPRAKGVLKRKSVNHESQVKNEVTPPPDHHAVVEVQQPKGEMSLLNDWGNMRLSLSYRLSGIEI
jgi:hypothetical protein